MSRTLNLLHSGRDEKGHGFRLQLVERVDQDRLFVGLRFGKDGDGDAQYGRLE